MTSAELIKLLEENGWMVVRSKGSHHAMTKPGHPFTLSIPHPRKDLGVGLVRQIKKKAGLL